MAINTEADQKERHAIVLCLFIVPDIPISRVARGERKAVLGLVVLVSICVLWFGKSHQW